MTQIITKLGMIVAMLLSFLQASARSFEVDDIEYYVTSEDSRTVELDDCDRAKRGACDIPRKVEAPSNGLLYTVTTIGEYAFSGCTGLTSVSIPNSVTTIESYAFSDCTGLTSITIPNSVTTIGEYAFSGCTGLTEINVDTGNDSFASIEGVLYDKDIKHLISYPLNKPGTTFGIPNSVTTIGQSAFSDCTGLTSVSIPNTVTTIGEYAFSDCTGLTSVSIPNSVTTIGWHTFSGCMGLTSVTIPNSVTTIGLSAFSGCTGLTSVSIPNSVTTIESYAFSGCTGLTSVSIPNSVTTIESSVFSGCTGLTSVSIPNSVTTIGWYAFSRCTGLTSVSIPNSVTTIGQSAFSDCTGLTSITIPNSVTTIGSYAFSGSSLESVYCQWEEPVRCDDSLFSKSCYEEGTLYVPVGCADKYNFMPPWSNFWNIEEMDYSGIGEVLENQPEEDYVVYNLHGIMVLKTKDIENIKQLPAGLYIVNGKKMKLK